MYSVSMAIVDFIPVILFLASVIILQKELYYQFTKWQFALFTTGGTMCFIAGLFKATYKLLYASNICDFQRLNLVFFPLQATGFILLGFSMVAFLVLKKKTFKAAAAIVAAPPVYEGTMIFVAGIILGLSGFCGSLIYISIRLKKYGIMILNILAFVFLLGMGYLSTKDFDNSLMNWIAQITNIFGQGMLLAAAILIKKAGLKNYSELIKS